MFSMASYACSAKKIITVIYNIFHVQLFELSTGGGGGAFKAFCYIPYTFVDSINVFDCHLSDVFIEYTEIVAKTIRN